jgi:hypothetical protein
MSVVAYTPAGYVFGLFLMIVFFLAVVGVSVGSFLAEFVKAKVMLVGSVVYWVVALPNGLYMIFFYVYQPGLFQSVSTGLFLSMPAVLCADITYMIKYLVKKRRSQS